MGEGYSQGNAEAQRMLVSSLIQTIKDREYSQLSILLEMLSKSFDDKKIAEEIVEVKRKTTIEFGTFELLYKLSFKVDPRRAVVLKHPYYIERVPFPVVRRMFETEVIRPFSEIAIELVGRISVDKSVFLKNFISGQSMSKGAMETVDDIKNKKVDIQL